MSDDELLRRFLLGRLSAREAEVLEQRLLQDNDLAELAEAVEGDILDEYARGKLSAAERDRVAAFLAASPSGRLRLAVIRGLGEIADSRGRLLQFPRSYQLAALAATLAIAVGAGWLVQQQALPEPAAPDTPVAGHIAGVRPTPAKPAPEKVVLQLALNAVRAQEGIPPLRLPAPDSRVEIHLRLAEAERGFSSFQIILLDDRGAQVVPRAYVRPQRLNGSQTLILPLEGNRLREGTYLVEVGGVTAAGTIDPIAFRQFQVLSGDPG